MALSALFIMEIMILASFIVTSIFMFIPKGNETVHIIFFWLSVALSVLVTFIDATALPSNYVTQIVIAWAGLIFTALGIIVRLLAGKTNVLANILVMLSSIYGAVGFFILM